MFETTDYSHLVILVISTINLVLLIWSLRKTWIKNSQVN